MSRKAQVAIVTVLAALCCCLAAVALGVVVWATIAQIETTPVALVTPLPSFTLAPSRTTIVSPTSRPLATPTAFFTPAPTPTASSTPAPTPTALTPTATQDSLPSSDPTPLPSTTEGRLLNVELPQRDIRRLAERLRKTGPIPEVVHDMSPVYTVGDRQKFWIGNVDTMEQFEIDAVLHYVTPHLYMWVEEGLSFDRGALARSAEKFESHTYVVNRAFFGSEWLPGVDNDPHLHILHSTGERMGRSVAGYYSSADEYSQLADPYSNEREMFYISLSGMRPGSDFYDGVLAHEFQHMIHWANDRNEDTWVNEGCAELASYLNGYDPGGFDWLFVGDPDVQLTAWAEGTSTGAHYGNSYLFVAYFLGRFGEETMQRVVAHPANGIAGFDAVLKDSGLTFDDVFADWVVANYVDNLSAAGSGKETRYVYPDHIVGPVAVDLSHGEYPVRRQSTVHQYAADYVELAGQGDLVIEFSGDTWAKLVPVDAHSGQYAWWSNRGDDSDTMLTRAFDLRSLDQATLQVWMWFDIERDWDYAYVEVSIDGGQTWDVLSGPSATITNPNGNSFGPAYTGKSDGWIQEAFDLGAYAGHEVLIRFEYVTDDAVNRAGWLIDDVRIPELGYNDDLESGPEEWQADGFVYSDNRVSQRYIVQLIAQGRGMQVHSMVLDENQSGQINVRGLGERLDSAVLVISALAPVTTEIAAYEYTVRPIETRQ